MGLKKKIQIFYGGFVSVKGGVNVHSNLLKKELKKKTQCCTYHSR